LRIPVAAITSVSTDPYQRNGLRLGGTSIPFTDIRAGRFRRQGLRTFLFFEHRDHVITLDLDRARSGLGYDGVAVGPTTRSRFAHRSRLARGG
jgi:hypothetical protein